MASNKNRDQIIIDCFYPLIEKYLNQLNNDPVVHYLKPEQVPNIIDLNLSQEGLSDEELLHQISQYLTYCVHTGNHQFFNQLWSGFDAIGFTAELLIALTNTSMYTYDVAPLATFIEMTLIRRLSDIVGFPETSGGTFVTGGSNGNLVAMLAARNRCLALGHSLDDLCVIYSDNAHYSMDIDAMVIGISQKNIFKIPHTSNQAMSVSALEEILHYIIDMKKIPCFVAATAGTTVAGVFDPIQEIAVITTRHPECWLHIDAAHGGAVMFSAQYKSFLNGCEQADSLVWDAHKTLGAPLICSVLLVKDKQHILFHHEQSSANDYLYHNDQDHRSYDLGRSSIQCGRRADCIKLWLMWQRYGLKGFETIVNHLMDLKSYAVDIIAKQNDLLLIGTPEYLNICFFYKPAEQLSEQGVFYRQLKKKLHTNEIMMLNIAKIEGKHCFRLVITNKKLGTEDIDSFFKQLLECCEAHIHQVVGSNPS